MTVSNRSITLSAITSSGAPVYDNNYQTTPKNQVTVYGLPGTRVTVSCDAPAFFSESNDHVWSFTLTVDGKQTMGIHSPDNGHVGIFIQDDDDPANAVVTNTTFGAYHVGDGDIRAYAGTTGAPADGLVPCSLYVLTSNESSRDNTRAPITKVHVSLDNGATFIGYAGSSADILLNDDSTVEIDIVNTVPGTVTATVTLPEESGPVIRSTMVFMQQP